MTVLDLIVVGIAAVAAIAGSALLAMWLLAWIVPAPIAAALHPSPGEPSTVLSAVGRALPDATPFTEAFRGIRHPRPL